MRIVRDDIVTRREIYDSENIQHLYMRAEANAPFSPFAFHRARGILLIISRVIELSNDVKVETLQSEIATEASFIFRARWYYCRRTGHAIHFRKRISIFPRILKIGCAHIIRFHNYFPRSTRLLSVSARSPVAFR